MKVKNHSIFWRICETCSSSSFNTNTCICFSAMYFLKSTSFLATGSFYNNSLCLKKSTSICFSYIMFFGVVVFSIFFYNSPRDCWVAINKEFGWAWNFNAVSKFYTADYTSREMTKNRTTNTQKSAHLPNPGIYFVRKSNVDWAFEIFCSLASASNYSNEDCANCLFSQNASYVGTCNLS